MDVSKKKPVTRRPRILHGPHRLRSSGAASRANVVIEDVIGAVTLGDPEVVSSEIEVSVEVVQPTDPAQ